MSDDLKPCPFCYDDDVTVLQDYGGYYVWCSECEADGPFNRNREKAVRMWNQALRKEPDPHAA